jgi:hypothetical protein
VAPLDPSLSAVVGLVAQSETGTGGEQAATPSDVEVLALPGRHGA